MIAACPTCGKEFESDTLKGIQRKINACRHGATYVAPAALPVELFVPFIVKSHNAFNKAFWKVYSDYKKACKAALAAEDLTIFGKMLGFSRWEYVRCYTGREREFDDPNFVAGTKPVTDSLVQLGVMVDDRPCNFQATYIQQRGDRSGIILRLLEVDAVPRTAS